MCVCVCVCVCVREVGVGGKLCVAGGSFSQENILDIIHLFLFIFISCLNCLYFQNNFQEFDYQHNKVVS